MQLHKLKCVPAELLRYDDARWIQNVQAINARSIPKQPALPVELSAWPGNLLVAVARSAPAFPGDSLARLSHRILKLGYKSLYWTFQLQADVVVVLLVQLALLDESTLSLELDNKIE